MKNTTFDKSHFDKSGVDKSAYLFTTKIVDIEAAIDNTLSKGDCSEYAINLCGGLLTTIQQYVNNGFDEIKLSAAESATLGLYNKRSVSAKKVAEKRKLNKERSK